MKDKIGQIDVREAELIKRFDVQSEKFGGKILLFMFFPKPMKKSLYSNCTDHPLYCSSKTRGEVHRKS